MRRKPVWNNKPRSDDAVAGLCASGIKEPKPMQYRLFRPDGAHTALGLAVAYLMAKPAFATLPFGEWSKILVGQINRRHYAFVVDHHHKVRGFIGYARTTLSHAEAWARGMPLSNEVCTEGECLIINAWAADATPVVRFLLEEVRRVGANGEWAYFVRRYPDGSSRPSRLSVNEFVRSHIERNATLRGTVTG